MAERAVYPLFLPRLLLSVGQVFGVIAQTLSEFEDSHLFFIPPQMMAKTRGDTTFKGKLVVLIDSQSGSSAEIFARTIQIEKRGTVIGDRSAGAVMEAKHYSFKIGADVVIFYGASITDADLIMTDGQSLERTGVKPDELLLPTAADLAAKRDPVLARAAALVGLKLDPEKAGAMFPVEWRK